MCDKAPAAKDPEFLYEFTNKTGQNKDERKQGRSEEGATEGTYSEPLTILYVNLKYK